MWSIRFYPRYSSTDFGPFYPKSVGPFYPESSLIFKRAFVLGRRAVDQIVIAEEMINRMLKLKGSGSMAAVRLDIEKAYDTIRGDFLHFYLN